MRVLADERSSGSTKDGRRHGGACHAIVCHAQHGPCMMIWNAGHALGTDSTGAETATACPCESDTFVGSTAIPDIPEVLHGFLWEDGQFFDRNDLIPAESDVTVRPA